MKETLVQRLLLVAIGLAGAWATSFTWSSDIRDIPGYPTNIDAYDAREIALLPRYCIYTQLFRERVPGGNNPAEIERWYRLQGPTFHAMHHYCWGLMRTNRALFLARTKEGRDRYLQEAISDFDYVIERAPADFILLPEILTKKGEHLIRLKQEPMALPLLEQAIDLKPDYWPPYVALSDYYKQRGDVEKARDVLQKALTHAPEATAVKKRLSELGTAPKRRQKP